jgi:hypothetical protein
MEPQPITKSKISTLDTPTKQLALAQEALS